MTKAELYPTAKHLRDAIIYFMKEIDRLNEVRTANATPIPHVAFDLRKRDGKQVGVQHFQVPAGTRTNSSKRSRASMPPRPGT